MEDIKNNSVYVSEDSQVEEETKKGVFKIFRNVKPKRVLVYVTLLLLVCTIGYGGYLGYESYKNPPYRITISNVTDSSFTVSWVTNTPEEGLVYYREGSLFPGFLAFFQSKKAFDDRDVSLAQTICVNEFNSNAEVDEDFAVDTEELDCEDSSIEEKGEFYTHHVTIRNLDNETLYYFKIGNGFWSWNAEDSNIETFSVSEEVTSPEPIYGKVLFTDYVASDDSVVYIRFVNPRDEKESILYSSVTNEDGGWALDSSGIKTEDGDDVEMEAGLDYIYVVGQFANFKLGEVQEWVYGQFDAAYPDIEVGKNLFDYINEKDSTENSASDVLGIWDTIKSIFTGSSSSDSSSSGSSSSGSSSGSSSSNSSSSRSSSSSSSSSRTTEERQAINAANTALKYTALTQHDYEEKAKDTSLSAEERANYSAKADLLDQQVTSLTKAAEETAKGDEDYVDYFTGSASNSVKKEIKEKLGTTNNAKYFSSSSSSSDNSEDSSEEDISYADKAENYLEEKIPNARSTDDTDDDNWTVADESALGDVLCPTCSGFVTTEQMIEILDDPSQASKYATTIGIGNVARILTSSGITIDEEVMTNVLHLDYNAGNINALSVNALSGNEVIKQTDLETYGNIFVLGESGTYVNVSSNEDGDENGDEGVTVKSLTEETKKIREEINDMILARKGGKYNYLDDTVDEDSTTEMEKSSENGLKTGKLIFSNAAFNLPVELTEDGLTFTFYRGENRSESLVYNTKTDQYEINNIGGLVQYTMASLFETAAFVGSDTVAEVLSDLPIVKLQSPVVLEATVSKEKIQATIDLESPIVFSKGEDDWFWGSIINFNQGISDTIREMEEGVLSSVCIQNGSSSKTDCVDKGVNIVMEEVEDTTEDTTSLFNNVIHKTYAYVDEDNGANEDFVFYTSEDGLIDINVDGVTIANNVDSATNDFYVFYSEGNGISGYQAPEDWDNPSEDEDKIITSKSIQVEFEKKSEMYKMELKQGVNLVSFDFVPFTESGNILTAQDLLIKYADQIKFMGIFSSGKWVNIIRAEEDSSNGLNFEIVPGTGYVIFANYNTTLYISGNSLSTPVPCYLSKGWNLVGINGYDQEFTASSFIYSVNEITGLKADNVSGWSTSLGKYEVLQVEENINYGLDFAINDKKAYFIRVTELESSEDENCTSIIWNKGTDFHGLCGSSE